MLGEDDRDIFLSAGLDHLQYVLQNGLGNPMEKVLHINREEGSMLWVYPGLFLPIGF
jgi:hypothetical protein